ncbi:RecF/RecN/SMC protein [Lojkania enalia]|uniref:Structural maintenance of chromosomes protein n=1 Tax=Lojkania enalia TaxID=147567 RepID=A0A9P4K3E5_9PLEO|nr:RecF/RecN/SMC protein [Didymosphaeria enalia]
MGYIKQITIQGFKSYKDQTQIEPFSPKSNVVVGRNGSGKSNFFAAVRFALGDDYNNLGREGRQALLHEGSGSAVMSAYVEICFDNEDDRFHTGRPEFYLRRTIGLKKDEYSVDRKNATKIEVRQILESAGFSVSNPYYIVPQGRVTQITNMKDADRLNLLKDISGSVVYENRRKESLKLLTETDTKRKKIDELVQAIETRLEELRGEKEELEAYNRQDRDRRALRYAIERQREDALQRQIDDIDSRRNNGVAESDHNQQLFIQTQNEIAQIEEQTSQMKSDIELLKDERAQLETDRRESARSKAKCELELKELTDGQSAAQRLKRRHDSELRDVQQKIKARQDELNQLLPNYNSKKEEEAELRAQLEDAQSQRKRLEDKQGRTTYYKNKRQRDDALRQEIDQISVDMAHRKSVLIETRDEISDLENDIKRLESEIADLTLSIDNQGDNTMDIATQVQAARDARDNLTDQRKNLWREDAKLIAHIRTTEQRLGNAEALYSHMMDYNTSRGLHTLNRLKKLPQYANDLRGVHGTIAELVQVRENYKTVTEVVAGTSLFHVVVDNDATATKLVDLLNKEKGGRLTTIPLNRVHPRPIQYPKTNDAVPLISKLEYDLAYDNAFQHIFGKSVICPDLTIALGFARTHGLNALTIDGDKADKKGRLTGGYIDSSKSRLDATMQVATLRHELEEHRARKSEIDRELKKLEQQITAAQDKVQKIQYQQVQVERSYGPMRQELRAKQTDLQNKKDSLEAKHRTASSIESEINHLGNHQTDLETDLASDFKKSLSDEEEQLLARLAVDVRDLQRQLSTLTRERSTLEIRKDEIEVELRNNLQPSLDRLLTEDGDSGGNSGQTGRLRDAERSLKRISKTLDDFDSKIEDVDNKIEEANTQLMQLEVSKAEKYASNRELAKTIEKQLKRMDRGMKEKQTAQENLKEVQQAIRELGTLPDEAWRRYANWNIDKLSRNLEKINGQLRKYSHINKKAFEQYEKFTKDRRTLTERRQELETSRTSIEELIDILDQRKDEAIQRTFKQVSKAFSEIFVQLVPAGIGRLLIQRKSDREAGLLDDSDEEEGRATGDGVESYRGVGIQVSFNSKHDEQQRISQLSGGQKSLCALALIFAIQQCDPAPFYLFDEIDANLDAQYRTAVAQMLKKLSGKGGEGGEGGGQFICTTFRPEMVLVADKCYGVSYSNKTSSIDVVGREVALDFVEGMTKV